MNLKTSEIFALPLRLCAFAGKVSTAKAQSSQRKTNFLNILCATLLVGCCFAFSAFAQTSEPKKTSLPKPSARVVIVPLDDRPATTQFAEMIGDIGAVEVTFPPGEIIGTFLTPGDSEKIADWLRKYDFSRTDALVLSIDMLAFGGFMNSRMSKTPLETALRRIEIVRELKRKNPRLPIYAFNVVRRVALSATRENRAYRDKIARWSVLADETEQKPNDPKLNEEFARLQKEIAPEQIADYLAVRKRNLNVNLTMLEMAKAGTVDKLLLLQDDAHRFGLHRRDQNVLRERIKELGLNDERAVVYNGADEGASVLLSRTVLQKHDFKPRVRVVYSSEAGRTHLGDFEDQPIETSVKRQIETSGAQIVEDATKADYTLYVNAPQQTEAEFQNFLNKLISDLKNNRRVAIADVLYRVWGGGDERIITALGRENLLHPVAGYASWGTPGNALGTVVPQTNMYVFARQRLFQNQSLARKIEAANVRFLFHRWTGDYGYHVLVRPAVNRYARQDLKIEVEEFDRETYEKFNRIVVERMMPIARDFFARHFQNRFYPIAKDGKSGIVLKEIENLEIRLPWARTFEIFMDFDFRFAETNGKNNEQK